jgi:hypothetical protein
MARFARQSTAAGAKREYASAVAIGSIVIALVLASVAALVVAITEWSDSGQTKKQTSNIYGEIPKTSSCQGSKWWVQEFEYFHLESYVLVALAWLTMFLDLFNHKFARMSQVSLVAEEDAPAIPSVHWNMRVSLWETLRSRCIGELMVLGSLAIFTHICKKAEVFEKLAVAFRDNVKHVRLPRAGDDYLHMVQEVHMQLFVAMSVYAFLLILTVFGSSQAEKRWQLANVAAIRHFTGSAGLQSPEWMVDDEREFYHWRQRFVSALEDRRGNWQDFDKLLAARLALLSKSPGRDAAETPSNAGHDRRGSTKSNPTGGRVDLLMKPTLSDLLMWWFPFETYLALHANLMMQNLMEIKASTWFALGVLQFLRAVLLVESETLWIARMPEVVCGVLIVFLFFLCVWNFGIHESGSSSSYRNFFCRRGPWLTTIHLLQMILCGVCFNIARNSMSEHYWKDDTPGTLIGVILGLLCLLGLGGFLGLLFPRMVMMAARPEFLLTMHLPWLCAILDDHILNQKLGRLNVDSQPLSPSGPAPLLQESMRDIGLKRLQTWANNKDVPTSPDWPLGVSVDAPVVPFTNDDMEELSGEPPSRERSDSDHSVILCTPSPSRSDRKLAWTELN